MTFNNARIETDEFRITADPHRGGKIVEIFAYRLRRNLLAEERPDAILRLEKDAVFSVAGWDEAFPTLEPSGGYPTLGQAWRTAADCRSVDNRLVTQWNMPPWVMEREITTVGETITACYAITNTSAAALPALWASHLLFPLDGLVHAELPLGRMVPGPGCELNYLEQQLSIGCAGVRIEDTSPLAKSWKFFLPANGPVVLQYRDACLSLTTEALWWGIWLNRGVLGTRCLGIEPTNAPTDVLDEARTAIAGGEILRTSWQVQVKPL